MANNTGLDTDITQKTLTAADLVQNDELTFPYPEGGGPRRAPGNGCTVCVHKGYCTALYYFRRYTKAEPDKNNGTDCKSWSKNPKDQIKKWSQHDVDENIRLTAIDGILTEPNRNGIVEPTTGAPNKPFM